ncbi:glycosyltransferase family 4 protein [Pedobacter foliorum]|uniref:glycosyltransferase family 4 protein n=1 Tax=Pedobacter foliorum TaxID=2739058 RepID=UPI0015670CC8|nr:glycosyltransferase family 4 protein [Pedobacter foliorum]NRF39204.1 glycosyltransferase family 4 protein [Pedobacter foliorum]
MKKILYFSFYFEPDLCAGSFRNSPLAKELVNQLGDDVEIDVVTTLPNRYGTFDASAPAFEDRGNMKIHRILIPKHKSGFIDQINSFKTYFLEANRLIKDKKYDMVFSSSSRLFTAYLGYTIAKKQGIPLYLDVRDIFIDTMKDVLKNPILKAGVMPILKIIERKVFSYATHINLISGGFKSYFEKFKQPKYSYFSNGIDPEFLNLSATIAKDRPYKLITYAGNLGEGQGLHIIVPQAAKALGEGYRFLIIGDGGVKQKLIDEIERLQLTNVELRKPVARKELLKIYDDSDFLFLHLNDYDAFKKVLPSKIFELGAYDKPIIAGVAGFANQFIDENIPNRILFLPGQVDEMVRQLGEYKYHTAFRNEFKAKFKRDVINTLMAKSIIENLL